MTVAINCIQFAACCRFFGLINDDIRAAVQQPISPFPSLRSPSPTTAPSVTPAAAATGIDQLGGWSNRTSVRCVRLCVWPYGAGQISPFEDIDRLLLLVLLASFALMTLPDKITSDFLTHGREIARRNKHLLLYTLLH